MANEKYLVRQAGLEAATTALRAPSRRNRRALRALSAHHCVVLIANRHSLHLAAKAFRGKTAGKSLLLCRGEDKGLYGRGRSTLTVPSTVVNGISFPSESNNLTLGVGIEKKQVPSPMAVK